MNKRSRKKKGLSHRLIALLLCCVCLLTAMPIPAFALETSITSVAEGVLTEQATEEVTVTPENTATVTKTSTELSNSEDTFTDADDSETETIVEPADTMESETMSVEQENVMQSETTPTIEAENKTESETTPTIEAENKTESETMPIVETETEEILVSQSFYDKVIASQSCEEIFKLFQSEENSNAILLLTIDELTSMQTHVNDMEGDGWKDDLLEVLDMLIAIASDQGDGKETDVLTTFNIINNISNATVAYVKYSSGSASDITFTTVTSGQEVSESSTSGVLIFFLKPADGYLLTQYKNAEGKACDLYGISIPASQSNIYWFKNNSTVAQTILDQAKALGYVGYYAFSYASGTTKYSATYMVEGQKPQMVVNAIANPNADLKPGDKVTFTVTITPGDLAGVDEEVTGVRVTSLKINGTEYTATKNADGTYSVEYEITEIDWMNQSAHLDVEAELDYKYAVGVTDRNSVSSDILTTTTITGNASTDCTFASKQGVVYQVKFDPADKADPSKFPTTPVDSNTYFQGDMVTVDTAYNKELVDDPVNKGTWTFNGWYHGDEKVGNTLLMGSSNILLVGTWRFTPYPNANLTIRKTVSGNMQDSEKAFTFTITADKAMTYNGEDNTIFTFNLKKNEEVVISVPVGVTVTVSEDADDYTYSIGSDTTITDYTNLESSNGITFIMPNDDSIVVFNNAKDIIVDTGVILDTLPYVLILVVVVTGAVVLIKRRREYDDD